MQSRILSMPCYDTRMCDIERLPVCCMLNLTTPHNASVVWQLSHMQRFSCFCCFIHSCQVYISIKIDQFVCLIFYYTSQKCSSVDLFFWYTDICFWNNGDSVFVFFYIYISFKKFYLDNCKCQFVNRRMRKLKRKSWRKKCEKF
jgi:hypothetical protein